MVSEYTDPGFWASHSISLSKKICTFQKYVDVSRKLKYNIEMSYQTKQLNRSASLERTETTSSFFH